VKKYIAYYRVSTARQGQSGLGMEAQQAAVRSFATGAVIQSEYKEVESGTKTQRPQLDAAIAESKSTGATLLIAKVDRLARNVAFTSWLMETGVDFVCVDNPTATRLTIHIFAAIAENETAMISQRVKAALAAKKARGFKLGSPAPMREDIIRLGQEAIKHNARTNKANVQAMDIILDKRALGWNYQQIAVHLNAKEYKTRRGCYFRGSGVRRLELVAKELSGDGSGR
jgi:DNA invertase Pin-like site-specific DNA recombinase